MLDISLGHSRQIILEATGIIVKMLELTVYISSQRPIFSCFSKKENSELFSRDLFYQMILIICRD